MWRSYSLFESLLSSNPTTKADGYSYIIETRISEDQDPILGDTVVDSLYGFLGQRLYMRKTLVSLDCKDTRSFDFASLLD